MITMLMFDPDGEESRTLMEQSSYAVAHQSEDQLVVNCFARTEQARKEVEKGKLLDVAFLDVTAPGGIVLSKEVRRENELAQLLLIADASVSPMNYMTPDIRAASLLLRPFQTDVSKQIVYQFFQSIFREQNEAEEDRKMVIENREGRISIPYSKIYYIEVRGKKIYVRLKEKEYSKYETMDNMMKQLPDDFIRCHRSFVVNKTYITRLKISENTIYLQDDIMVPLSRSYKPDLKEYMKNQT